MRHLTLIAAALLMVPGCGICNRDPRPTDSNRRPNTPQSSLGFNPYDQSGVPLEVKPPPGFAGKVVVLTATPS